MNYLTAIARLERLKRNIKTLVGNEMVNFALDNIRDEKDINGIAMRKRKSNAPRNTGRGLLVDTGAGRRSIRDKSQGDIVELEGVDYMVAHNEGATIRGTYNVRAHSRRRRNRTEQVSSHQRTVDFTLPERKFTGKSSRQTGRINRMIQQQIVKALT